MTADSPAGSPASDAGVSPAWRKAEAEITDLQSRLRSLSEENARLTAALEEIGEFSSYPIDYRDGFHEAMHRARRALAGGARASSPTESPEHAAGSGTHPTERDANG